MKQDEIRIGVAREILDERLIEEEFSEKKGQLDESLNRLVNSIVQQDQRLDDL